MDQGIFSLADNIIEILKQKKIVELSELVKLTNADERDIKLILDLLEKEQLVNIGYRLTKTLISWNDEADRLLMKMNHDQKITSLDSPSQTPKKKKRAVFSALSDMTQNISPDQNKLENDDIDKGGLNFNVVRDTEIDSSTDNHVLEQQIRATEKKLQDLKDIKIQKKRKRKKQPTYSKKTSKRDSKFNIGAFSVKEKEVDNEIDSFSSDAAGDPDEFELFNSKHENIIRSDQKLDKAKLKPSRSKMRASKNKSQSKAQLTGKNKKEIDREVEEIEETILSRLNNSLDGEVLSLDESDVVVSGRKNQLHKEAELIKKKLLGVYKADDKRFKGEDTFVPAAEDQEIEKLDKIDRARDLQNKLSQIMNKKLEIADLNKEKALLFNESHLELKSRLLMEISAMNDLISEKEGKLNDLKNKINVLPTRLEEMNLQLSKLKNQETELKAEFDIIHSNLSKLKQNIHESKSDAQNEFLTLKSQIKQYENELNDINGLFSKTKSKELEVSASIDIIKQKIKDSQAELVDLEGRLEELNSNSNLIEVRIQDLNNALTKTNKQIEISISKLNNLDEFSSKADILLESFSRLKSNIDHSIGAYQKQIVGLKESIKLDFTNRYLDELYKLTVQNANDFKSLLNQSEKIDMEIKDKKNELMSLIEEAKKLQASISGPLGKKDVSGIMNPNIDTNQIQYKSHKIHSLRRYISNISVGSDKINRSKQVVIEGISKSKKMLFDKINQLASKINKK
ncbi:MAG: hypothetical protein ACTSVV_17790 [Promethearchaeota archaeon]